jgi:hypothetical protein
MSDRWIASALVLSYPAMVAAALWPNAVAFALAALVAYVADQLVARRGLRIDDGLTELNIGVEIRFLVGDLALLVLLVREGHAGESAFTLLAFGLLGLQVLRGAYSALTLFVIRRRRLPVVVRGVDLSELQIPDAPSPLLTTRHTRTMLLLDVPVLAGALLAPKAGVVGLAVAYALGLAAIAVMACHALRNRHLGDEDRIFSVVNRRLAELSPEVALYFSGTADSAYQANMWLSTMDELGRPAVVFLRERIMMPLIGQTRTPVICVARAADMVRLDLSSVRSALYPANVGKNLHMLRMAGIRSAFIGHGDSDKPASFNPYSKVYDEVWVAGPAGRQRYRTAQVGVRDEDIVEVGRPQLTPIDTTGVTPDPMFTVLYAPTWEGWSDDLAHSSVATMGPRIVQTLLDHSPNVRVLYKPHPLTGTRDPKVLEVHREIVAMIERANRTREGGDASQRERLDQLTRRLSRFTEEVNTGDEAQITRDSARLGPPEGWTETVDAWREAYWTAGGPWRHRVVTGPRPDLYDCFNRTDLLITDISSVTGDFIVTGKPYAVTNVKGMPVEEYHRLFPTAAKAAYLLHPDCGALVEVLAHAQSDLPDPLTEARGDLRYHLLGDLDSDKRFGAAITALCADSLISTDNDRPAA